MEEPARASQPDPPRQDNCSVMLIKLVVFDY